MNSLPIYVLIPTHNRDKLLNKTLASLSRVIKPINYSSTIVVENGIRNNVQCIVSEYQEELNAQYLFVEEGNKSNALNCAISKIKENNALLFFTDDDAKFDKNVFKSYSETLIESCNGYYFGGTVIPIYEREPDNFVRKLLPGSAIGFRPKINKNGPSYFLGINWVAFKQDIINAGGFDPDYGPGSKKGARGQEARMQKALYDNGVFPKAVPGAIVYHHVPEKNCTLIWATKRLIQEGLKYAMEYDRELTVKKKFKKLLLITATMLTGIVKFIIYSISLNIDNSTKLYAIVFRKYGRVLGILKSFRQ